MRNACWRILEVVVTNKVVEKKMEQKGWVEDWMSRRKKGDWTDWTEERDWKWIEWEWRVCMFLVSLLDVDSIFQTEVKNE